MVEATVYFFPGSLDPTFGEWGLSIKGLGISEKEEWGSVAGYLSFGHVSGFNHTFQGNAFELGVVASKDWVRVRPYVGAALLAGTGEVSQSLALAENDTSLLMRFHGFLGTEVIVPADLAFQLDWFGFGWGASTFVGYRF
jgi:hypothetical protein